MGLTCILQMYNGAPVTVLYPALVIIVHRDQKLALHIDHRTTTYMIALLSFSLRAEDSF